MALDRTVPWRPAVLTARWWLLYFPHPPSPSWGSMYPSLVQLATLVYTWWGLKCVRYLTFMTGKATTHHKQPPVSTPGLATVEPMCVQIQTCTLCGFDISGCVCFLRTDLYVDISPQNHSGPRCGPTTDARQAWEMQIFSAHKPILYHEMVTVGSKIICRHPEWH